MLMSNGIYVLEAGISDWNITETSLHISITTLCRAEIIPSILYACIIIASSLNGITSIIYIFSRYIDYVNLEWLNVDIAYNKDW